VTLAAEVSSASYSEALEFHDAAIPTIVHFPIEYEWWWPTSRIRTNHLWAQRVWPSASVNYVPWGTLAWRPDRRYADEPNEEARKQCLSLDLIRRMMHRYNLSRWWRGTANGGDLYLFGWLNENADIGVPGTADTAWAGGARRVAFALDRRQDGPELFAQETAHLLRRYHTNTGECGDRPSAWNGLLLEDHADRLIGLERQLVGHDCALLRRGRRLARRACSARWQRDRHAQWHGAGAGLLLDSQ